MLQNIQHGIDKFTPVSRPRLHMEAALLPKTCWAKTVRILLARSIKEGWEDGKSIPKNTKPEQVFKEDHGEN